MRKSALEVRLKPPASSRAMTRPPVACSVNTSPRAGTPRPKPARPPYTAPPAPARSHKRLHPASPAPPIRLRAAAAPADRAARNVMPWPEVRDRLNATLRGWSNYFCLGDRYPAYRAVNHYVYQRVRVFLRRRHKVPSLGTARFSDDVVFGKLGVLRLMAPAKSSVS